MQIMQIEDIMRMLAARPGTSIKATISVDGDGKIEISAIYDDPSLKSEVTEAQPASPKQENADSGSEKPEPVASAEVQPSEPSQEDINYIIERMSAEEKRGFLEKKWAIATSFRKTEQLGDALKAYEECVPFCTSDKEKEAVNIWITRMKQAVPAHS